MAVVVLEDEEDDKQNVDNMEWWLKDWKTRAHIVCVYSSAMAQRSKLYKHLIIITNERTNERMNEKRGEEAFDSIYLFVFVCDHFDWMLLGRFDIFHLICLR